MYSAVMFQEVLKRRRELWRWGMQWPAIRIWQRPIERIIEAKLLTTTREAAQELIDHSTVIWHLKQTGKVKNLYNWCLTSWPKIKKIGVFQRHLLLFCTTTMNHFSNEWFEKSGLYTTTGNDQLSDWTKKKTKHVPKPSVHQKRSWSLFGGLLPFDSIQLYESGKTITSEKYAQQINEMHQKLQQLHQALVNRMGPILLQDVNFCLRIFT